MSISLNKLPCPNFSVHKQEEDKEKNFVCDICGYRTDRKQNLTKHNKVHNKKKCPFCDYLAVSKNYIELHIDKRHQEENGGDLNHICSQCGKGFLFKFSLTAHIYLHKNAPGGVLKGWEISKGNFGISIQKRRKIFSSLGASKCGLILESFFPLAQISQK